MQKGHALKSFCPASDLGLVALGLVMWLRTVDWCGSLFITVAVPAARTLRGLRTVMPA
jgi:hypothetical protein